MVEGKLTTKNYIALTLCGIAGFVIATILVMAIRHYYMLYVLDQMAESFKIQSERTIESSQQTLRQTRLKQEQAKEREHHRRLAERRQKEQFKRANSNECRFWRMQDKTNNPERIAQKIQEHCYIQE